METDDLNGWGPRAWDQLGKRVDALEGAIKTLVGRPPEAPPLSESELKVGGIGLGTWITLLATVVVPIVLAIVATEGLR